MLYCVRENQRISLLQFMIPFMCPFLSLQSNFLSQFTRFLWKFAYTLRVAIYIVTQKTKMLRFIIAPLWKSGDILDLPCPSFRNSVILYSGYMYLVGATPLTVFHGIFWNLADVLCMKWRCACGLGIIIWLLLYPSSLGPSGHRAFGLSVRAYLRPSKEEVKISGQDRISRPINGSKFIFHTRIYLYETSRNTQEPWLPDLYFTVHWLRALVRLSRLRFLAKLEAETY